MRERTVLYCTVIKLIHNCRTLSSCGALFCRGAIKILLPSQSPLSVSVDKYCMDDAIRLVSLARVHSTVYSNIIVMRCDEVAVAVAAV